MLDWFRTRNANSRKAKELYGAVVTAARQRELFAGYGVPDTFNGRYEMIVLVLFQLLERLRVEGAGAGGDIEELSRETLEAFFTDMDDCMREAGVGDLSVPKKVKRAAAGFYERATAYRAALAAQDRAGLAAALQRFIHQAGDLDASGSNAPTGTLGSSDPGQPDFAALADHMFRQRDVLAACTREDVLTGAAFPAPLGRAS